ncbi:Type 1 glutamine amidotransferase-like domain-containing protein [Fictibacillus nanhaiensis]|uniref:Type 1 glutamine amidotransferase-like domain-containing protein n=1 Tax=Fictibacillus nanhaiensis TaxID=742169 RepID=UPI003C28FD24
MLNMLLTSSFKDVVGHFIDFVGEDVKGKTVTFIPTASIPEEYDHYVYTAKETFKNLGIVVDELDVSEAPLKEITDKLKRNDYIYVSGGNVFFLLQELRISGAEKLIKEQIKAGKLYIGESAGSIVTSPNIEYVKFIDDVGKATKLHSFEGLNIIKFFPLPHYNNEPFKEAVNNVIDYYNSKLNLLPISNDQTIQIKEGNITVK